MEKPTPDSTHRGLHIVEVVRDFITRTPFEHEQFKYGALFVFNVHSHFSVRGA
jgi:hypothetical protein